MNETEWLTCTEPEALLDWVWDGHRVPSPRKRRLIGCACCRFIWSDLESDWQRFAVEMAESFAEGRVNDEELRQAWLMAAGAGGFVSSRYEHDAAFGTLRQVLERLDDVRKRRLNAGMAGRVEALLSYAREAEAAGNHRKAGIAYRRAEDRLKQLTEEERRRLAAEDRRHLCDAIRDVVGDLLRIDVIGNPYRVVAVEPRWLDANGGLARAIAMGIDADGRYDELPVLGDALEDAGCDDERILSHARQPRHYRGCWLIDAILGKA